MITSLTKEQEELLAKKRDEWINFSLFDGDDVDTEAVHEGIDFLYELSGLQKPIKIIVDSPMAAQLAIPLVKTLLEKVDKKIEGSQVGSQVESQVGSQVRSQVWSQVESQVGSQVESQVWSQVGSQVESQVGSQVRSQIGSQVWSQVWSQVESQVGSQVGSQVESQVRSQVGSQVESQVWSQVWSQVESQVRSQVGSPETFASDTLAYWASWAAWADCLREIGVDLRQNSEIFMKYMNYMKSGQFMGVYLNGLAVVCRRPIAVRRDDQLRLHNDQKPAIEWRDGYKLYFLHGQAFGEELFEKVTSPEFSLKDLMQITNADQRTEAWRILKPSEVLKGLKAKHLHTGVKGTKLYQVDDFAEKILGKDWNESEMENTTEYCMWMKDASTDREFIEWVDPKIGEQKDADLCQAHAFGIPLEDYLLMEQEA